MKKLTLVTIILLASIIPLIPTTQAQSTLERYSASMGDYLWASIDAPREVVIGQSFQVIIKFYSLGDIHIITAGAKMEGAGVYWEETIATDVYVSPGQTISRTATLTATQSGPIYCLVYGRYDYGWFYSVHDYGSAYTIITEARTKTYSQLSSDYDALSSMYNSLQATYSALQSNYNSLQSSYYSLQSKYNELAAGQTLWIFQLLSGVLAVTTLAFIITTIYFARRKPKVKA